MSIESFRKIMTTEGSAWVAAQRARFFPSAKPLPQSVQDRLRPYYGDLVASVRYEVIPHMENPEFYEKYPEMNLAQKLDFRQMMGMTFDDVILISEKAFPHEEELQQILFFHEMVHVVQYRILGVSRFLKTYIDGWILNGLNYFMIPLEAQAYELQTRFAADPEFPFDVTDELIKKMA